jgi:hypothetical protein
MSASKIHQNYTKKSLKLKQSVIEPGKYEVTANCGAKVLFSMKVECQNKNVAKNLAGLKYIELYCFPTFKQIYERIIGKECPEPPYIKDILKYDKCRREMRDEQLQKMMKFDGDLDSLTNSFVDQDNENDSSEE